MCEGRFSDIYEGVEGYPEAYACTDCKNGRFSGFDICLPCADSFGFKGEEIVQEDFKKAYVMKKADVIRKCPLCNGELEMKDGQLCCTPPESKQDRKE